MATKGKINVDFTMRYIGALRANRIVANPNRYSTINYKDIVTYAARAAHVPESSIEVAMDALYDALSYFVLNGHNVKIDGLGTFFFGINAYAEEQIENAGADAIHRLKIGYLPEKDLREAMNNVAVTTTYSNPGNLAVDTTVPPVAETLAWMLSQTDSNVHYFNDGDSVSIPEDGLYVRIQGARLDKAEGASCSIAASFRDGDETGTDLFNEQPVQILAASPKNLILFIPRADFGDVEIISMMLANLKVWSESGDFVDKPFTYPWAEYPAVNRRLLLTVGRDSKVFVGQQLIPVAGASSFELFFEGANMSKAPQVISFTNCNAEWLSAQAKYAKVRISNATADVVASGNIPALFNKYPLPITFVVAQTSTDPVVTSLSANGISVSNGGSSTVQAGQSYNFVFAGANLGGLTQSNLVVPQGATISNFAATASQVSFRLTIGENGGNIGINYNGASLFSVAVTIPTNIDATVTSIDGVSNNGSMHKDLSPDNLRVKFALAGTGLNSLTPANIVCAGATVELNTGTATSREATLTFSQFPSDGALRVQIDGTTIFTLNITWDMMY